MRLALIVPAFVLAAACGGAPKGAAPERKDAGGEVLGGEVTDAMLPLDTVRSTSPAGRSGPSDGASPGAAQARPKGPRQGLPKPQVSGGPEPDREAAPGVMPADAPPPE